MMYGIILLISCISLPCAVPADVLTLARYPWKLKNSNDTIQQEAKVPGGVFSDLRQAGVLNESIYYRFNDVGYRWVAGEDWTYSVDFAVNGSGAVGPSHELVFHGLDGHAAITFNKQMLGKTVNSFVRYRFDVSALLQHTNHLEIAFESPMRSANRSASEASHSVPPNCVPPDYHGECHVNFLRRMPASFGWDWGLAMPSVGVWKHAELVTYRDDLIVRDVTVSMIPNDKLWKVMVTVYCDAPLHTGRKIDGEINLVLRVENNHYIVSSKRVSLDSNAEQREVTVHQTLIVSKDLVKLWWPNGYGSQSLYRLSATFRTSVNENTKTISIGFRTAQLIQEPVNATDLDQGLTFHFSVNDVAIFAKGSNYIPASVLPENSSNRTTIRNLLYAAKMANMNMLRIWGGGIYETDYFYELCDQLGILIWQDMMFACSMYPADEQFLSTVEEEVNQQIKRLQYHPSIIIWAGNNENEAALSGNWYNTRSQYELYKSEYIKLYVDTIRTTVMKIDNTRTFLVSSPTNGAKSDEEGYVSKNPYSPLYGDVHYYNYLHDSWVTDMYPMTRFSSEYGFQSLPSLSTLRKVATTEDLAVLSSPFMLHRQHLPLGYLYLIYLLLLRFPTPQLTDLSSIIYISQIHQAWSVKSQTEWYRKWRSTLLPNGEGRTMGAMYWQLNDVWQAPSWSSIEFGGKWKMLQYYAKKFLAPVIVSGDLNSTGAITVNVISDLTYDIPNVELRIDVHTWASTEPVHRTTKLLTVVKEQADLHLVSSVTDLIESTAECKSPGFRVGVKCFLRMTLVDKSNGNVIHENFLFPVSFTHIVGLQTSHVKVTVESCTLKTCIIALQADAVSLFVWLDQQDIPGYFSDNGFTMVEKKKQLWFHSSTNLTPQQLQQSLSVTVLDKRLLDTFSHSNDSKSILNVFLNSSMAFLHV